ncbi:hypothetical protein OKA05_08110 [Luteolibacter arcticus]|uniref:Lipoprotein n=1 Tax=Luteolibacter arcticus TaxID=1581411 RepID=A0ABT3GFY1_9BACT|nr:hypothetical protein [Luteolibacter arcticus]MCW1922515.1 hypothetical protein [Luteolibacter arcticus]
MKTSLLAIAAVIPLLASCTGDPNSGGIFWSEPAAQQRLSDRQQRLDDVEGQTSRTRSDSRRKQAEIDRLSGE